MSNAKGNFTQAVPEDGEVYNPAQKGGYFVSTTGEKWNEERVDKLKRDHQNHINDLNKTLALQGNELATGKHQYEKACEEIIDSSNRWRTEQEKHKETMTLYRDAEREVASLRKAVDELKSILFQKELTIAQNSGYIQRVRELDPKHEERLVEVPANMVNLGNNPNQLMSADSYNGHRQWGQHWWQIGTEGKE